MTEMGRRTDTTVVDERFRTENYATRFDRFDSPGAIKTQQVARTSMYEPARRNMSQSPALVLPVVQGKFNNISDYSYGRAITAGAARTG